ncbi:NAD(P)/FAD-dependent oxidoreductase [Amycolatopsis sp. CA-230715]|uniref:NAD(P)/FAD-dependent oxidoreductase n=1 Tax=Amycolatopsis sp. CA-230715 TaxID=2745196 RepID=UPI001C009F7D|nr:FAD-binding oxidoreductase [Amycolatopsis sp. CA-230715]QWF78429.1 4-methylaminobutanoate oxidase (formaldehyde-forming) [Amycolatopsis sp. CA-230715]
MRIAVIGLGVLGASTARSLALAGAEVTVFERSAPGAGTTGTTFAWVNSHQKNPLSYHDLNLAGVLEHHELGGEEFRPTGNLEWADGAGGAERLRASTEQLRDRAYPMDWISPRRARELVPDLVVPPGVDEIAYFPEEGHVLPIVLLARLWGEARDHGAVLRCPAEVAAVSGGTVELADGTSESFDTVVLATGRWTEELASTASVTIPMAGTEPATVGFLGYTGPVAARVPSVLTTPRLNVRPDGGGRLVVQGLDLDADADPAAVPPADGEHAAELCARLRELVAGTEGVRLESLRVGQRAMPADGLTVAGFAAPRLYALATHSGITLGPLLGRLAAQEILAERESPLLADFRPERFDGVDRSELKPLTRARFAGQQ